MTDNDHLMSPITHLFLLTLRFEGEKSNVYSMGTSVDDAFDRYVGRLISRHETTVDLELVEGDFANPNLSLHQ